MNSALLLGGRQQVVGAMLLLLVVVSFCPGASGEEAEAVPVKTVNAVDIQKGKVVIAGSLGVPLGKMVLIRGTWIEGDQKHDRVLLHVTEIEGVKTTAIIDIRANGSWETGKARANSKWDWAADVGGRLKQPEPKKGDTWELVGYETAYMDGTPNGVYEDPRFEAPVSVASPGYHLQLHFVYSVMRKIE